MALITVQTFDNPIEAHQLKNKFESEGITCFLFDEHTVSINPLYSNTLGGIKLKIDDSDLERAQEIYTQIQKTPITNEIGTAIVCPRCESTELYSGFKTMKGISGIASMFVAFILNVFPIHYKTVYKCKACGQEFKE